MEASVWDLCITIILYSTMDPVCNLFKDLSLTAYIKALAILMTSFINYFSSSHQSSTQKSLFINFLVSKLAFLHCHRIFGQFKIHAYE